MKQSAIICLMGPTASGKTPLAVELVKRFPLEIISVDSAMVYRGMDIGTAKPDAATLKIAPHRLIDLVDPKEPYSAGQFRVDALQAIKEIHTNGKIPLLVGGTMLYFRVLTQGLATLPKANEAIRETLQTRAKKEGWETLHSELQQVDPISAARIHPNDSQRIQRALEVFMLTNKPISTWQAEDTSPLANYHLQQFALAPTERIRLHERIALRFDQMLEQGFIGEVRQLYERGDLSPDLPSLRSVGYRQAWDYLAGTISYEQMREQAIAATRQLAKRQLTWLRSWPDLVWLDSEDEKLVPRMEKLVADIIG